jgi:uncharacterized RDD family membrane protein YckC
MTTGESIVGQPSGWYKDPAPRNPAAPDSVRYWDGQNWTAQTRIASKHERQEWAAEALAAQLAYERQVVERAEAGDPEAQQILAAATAAGGSRWATPDGARLAGWWIRVAAYLIDGIVLGLLGSLLSWRFFMQIADAYRQFFDDSVSAARAGAPQPAATTLVDQTAGPFLWIGVIFLIVGFAYEVGFLKGFQATPGKLLLGLQVRLREAPGPLSWRTVLLRWAGKSGVGLLRLVPFGAILAGFYSLFDYLWPLWDPKRQALHDKLARTNVVRRG